MINKVNFTEASSPSLASQADLYKLYNSSGATVQDIRVVPVPAGCSHNFGVAGLASNDSGDAVAAWLGLLEHRALHLVQVPPGRLPTLPPDLNTRAATILHSMHGSVE